MAPYATSGAWDILNSKTILDVKLASSRISVGGKWAWWRVLHVALYWLKFKPHMMEKISIIAIIENTVSSCVQWDRRLYAHHSLVAKLPIKIKNSRSAERVYKVRSVTEHWSPSLPAIGNWWDPEGSKPRYCLNDKATSVLTKEGLLTVSRKPDNIANKAMTTITWSWMNNHKKNS